MKRLIGAVVVALSLQSAPTSADQWIGTDLLGTVSARTIIPLGDEIVQFVFNCSENEQIGKFLTATLSYRDRAVDHRIIPFGDRRFVGAGMTFSYNLGEGEGAVQSDGSEFGWPRHVYALRLSEVNILSLLDPGRSFNLAEQLATAFLHVDSVDVALITGNTDVSTERDIIATSTNISLEMDGFQEKIVPVFEACEIALPSVLTLEPKPQTATATVRTFNRDSWTLADTLLGPSVGIREAGLNGPDTSILTLACDSGDRLLTRLRMDYAVSMAFEDSDAQFVRAFPIFFNASGIVPIKTAPIDSLLTLLKTGPNEYEFVSDAEERDRFHEGLARYRSVQLIIVDRDTDSENWLATSKAIEFRLRGSSAAITSIRGSCLG